MSGGKESERNISAKLDAEALANYHWLLQSTSLLVAPIPSEKERESLQGVVEEKDEHVLAAALAVNAPFLLTLDQGLEEDINQANLPIRAFAPGGFIREKLVTHADYPAMRNEDAQHPDG